VLVGALSGALSAAPAAAGTCAPARLATDPASLPRAWQRALAALVEATSREGLPWGCNGALLSLELDAAGSSARLTVAMDGWPVLEREISTPDDLVPVGEALLARPIATAPRPIAPAPAPPTRPEPPSPPAPRAAAPRAPGEPRLLVDALTSLRYSGHVDAVWAGLEFRVAIPIESFSMGIWARYELAVHELQPPPEDFTMTSGSVGLAAGYRVMTRPIELTVSLEPSVAVVTMDGGPDLPGRGADGAKGDFRLGARVQGALPFSARWRGVFAIDGEASPLAIASAKHRTIAAILPPIPSFTLGASLGGELVIR
jgi:hypothetical protein